MEVITKLLSLSSNLEVQLVLFLIEVTSLLVEVLNIYNLDKRETNTSATIFTEQLHYPILLNIKQILHSQQ